ncbi:MAG TPA: trehalase family glycosidase [Acidobacteriaceae bacterium]
MPIVLRRSLIAALLFPLALAAQSPQPSPKNINTYIHQSWDTLSRSMSNCASIADPKLTTTPVLYLPAGEPIPPAVRAMQTKCHVDVRSLPRAIHHEGDLSPDAIRTPGLLYLPNRYVVPGGRFNEMYGWDSYFILLGELADNRLPLARGTVENFFYEIDHYGSILNANRTYYLTRSQPSFLSSMVLAIYDAERTTNPTGARTWLERSLPYLLRDHALWIAPPHLAGATGLSRYFDLGHGPVPEMADDSTYYTDVLHWLQAHPRQTSSSYLEKTSSRDEELPPAFYVGDRSMRESGFDTSFRFGPFSGSTEDYAPICLNALLFKYEHDLAHIETILDNPTASTHWNRIAAQRKHRINKLLWNNKLGLFVDYNFLTHQQSTYRYLTTYYALWSGLASPAQAKRLAANLPLFERRGGLQMSTQTTGEQWDAPFGWAPTNWLAVAGLARYGYTADALRIAREFTATVRDSFQRDHTLREKYNMDTSSSSVAITAGYKTNVVGFGWTNGVYLRMEQLLANPPARTH